MPALAVCTWPRWQQFDAGGSGMTGHSSGMGRQRVSVRVLLVVEEGTTLLSFEARTLNGIERRASCTYSCA